MKSPRSFRSFDCERTRRAAEKTEFPVKDRLYEIQKELKARKAIRSRKAAEAVRLCESFTNQVSEFMGSLYSCAFSIWHVLNLPPNVFLRGLIMRKIEPAIPEGVLSISPGYHPATAIDRRRVRDLLGLDITGDQEVFLVPLSSSAEPSTPFRVSEPGNSVFSAARRVLSQSKLLKLESNARARKFAPRFKGDTAEAGAAIKAPLAERFNR